MSIDARYAKQLTTVLACTITVGAITTAVLAVAAVATLAVVLVYVVNVAMSVLVELSAHIGTLYTHSDPALQFIIIVVLMWTAFKCFIPVVKSILEALK